MSSLSKSHTTMLHQRMLRSSKVLVPPLLYVKMLRLLTVHSERLRRLELYGESPSHPSEAPRRDQASVVVFHLGDVATCDAR